MRQDIDHAGRFYARRYGMAPMVRRLAGYLAVCEPREQSIAELAEALLASRSAIAGAVSALENLGMIHRSPRVVLSWRYVYPLVRFFRKRGDPAKAARVCVELAWTVSPAEISGRYITEHGEPGRYPATVADPAVQDQVTSTAEDLAQLAPTAAGRAMEENRHATRESGPC